MSGGETVSEGWTRQEARRRQRWCEGRGYANAAPVCGGKAVLLSDAHGEQRCQKCICRLGVPPSSKRHVLNEHDDCVSWCHACDENVLRGLNPDGTSKVQP